MLQLQYDLYQGNNAQIKCQINVNLSEFPYCEMAIVDPLSYKIA